MKEWKKKRAPSEEQSRQGQDRERKKQRKHTLSELDSS